MIKIGDYVQITECFMDGKGYQEIVGQVVDINNKLFIKEHCLIWKDSNFPKTVTIRDVSGKIKRNISASLYGCKKITEEEVTIYLLKMVK